MVKYDQSTNNVKRQIMDPNQKTDSNQPFKQNPSNGFDAANTTSSTDAVNIDIADASAIDTGIASADTTNTPKTPLAQNHEASKFEQLRNMQGGKKNFLQQWQTWAMAGVAILAVAGLIFGVYGINANVASQRKIEELEKQITEKDELIAKYGAQLGQIVNDSNKPGYNDDKNDNKNDNDKNPDNITVASKDYIYVGEWGIKLKIPKELKVLAYQYITEGMSTYETMVFWGVPTDTVEIPEFAKIDKNMSSLGALSRISKAEYDLNSNLGQKVYEDDSYVYLYSHPQAVFSTDEQEQATEQRAVDLIETMLTKDISKFQNWAG